jgi:DNA-binding NarL/FixJ family response regulator
MATATRPTPSVTDAGIVGVYLPAGFPAAEDIHALLDAAGYATAFELADSSEVVESCRGTEPDVLLLGAARADAAVLALAAEVREASAETKIVLICKRSGNGEVRKALDAGISGVVALNELAAMAPVIEVVRAGQLSVPGSRAGELEKKVLTSREKQILGLVVMGMTNAEIASKLFLAESTVKSHLSSAFAKLGVASRSEAASLILDPRSSVGLGILTIPSS